MTTPQEEASFIKEAAIGIQRRIDTTAFIRDVLDNAKQKGYDAKMIRKMAKLYVDQNAAELKAENAALFNRYESLPL